MQYRQSCSGCGGRQASAFHDVERFEREARDISRDILMLEAKRWSLVERARKARLRTLEEGGPCATCGGAGHVEGGGQAGHRLGGPLPTSLQSVKRLG